MADDNDVIIDDLQSELSAQLDEEDERKGIKVSPAWLKNAIARIIKIFSHYETYFIIEFS